MSPFPEAKGSCLCGAVKITLEVEKKSFDACHCSMCRKWGGGPAFSVDANHRFAIEGEASLGLYSSSAWAERGFCKSCGTHLFYRLKDGSYRNVSLGLLDDAAAFAFETQVFIDSKPDCYAFSQPTVTMTEAEVLAKFAPPSA